MRIVTFLFSLLVTAGAVVLAYFEFTETLEHQIYILAATALAVLLAFICGHFMYRTYANRKRYKAAESRVAELELKVNELDTSRLAREAELEALRRTQAQTTQARPPAPQTMDASDTQIIPMDTAVTTE